MSIRTFERDTTVLFTWVSSVAPDSVPVVTIQDPLGGAAIASITAQQSGATQFWALFTMPASEGYFVAEWAALKTYAGSAYRFTARLPFRVYETGVP